MMKDDIFKELATILSDFSGISKDNIFVESKLGYDLGFDGDDAVEVLEKISKTFKLDISNLDFNKYFYHESEISLFKGFISKLLNKTNANKEDITVKQLIEACIQKKWIE